MKTIKIAAVALMCSALAACGSSDKAEQTSDTVDFEETTEIAEEAAPSVLSDENVYAFFADLYNNYVFGIQNFDNIKVQFSDAIVTELREDFPYDGEGYAVWVFRTEAQDGPNEVSSLDQVTPLEDGWYEVKFTDMGIKGSHQFKLSEKDGKIFVEEYK